MAKKATPKKTNLKQGKYAAVITVRVLPEEKPIYDDLLKRYSRCKTYTDALLRAAKEVPELSKKIDILTLENSKLKDKSLKQWDEFYKLEGQLRDIKETKLSFDKLINAIKI